MAYDDKEINNSVFDDLKEKFQGLDQKQQIVILIVAGLFLFVMLSRVFSSGSKKDQEAFIQETAIQEGSIRKVSIDNSSAEESAKDVFSADGADDDVLRRNFVNQALGEFEALSERMERKDKERDRIFKAREKDSAERLAKEQQEANAKEERMRSLMQDLARQQEESFRLMESLKEQQMKEKEAVGSFSQQQDFLSQEPIRERKQKITQESLSMGTNNMQGVPLVAGLTSGILGGEEGAERERSKTRGDIMEKRNPFIPPLGFIKGTMLNGVDALTAGTTTPALVRLEGVYKTAMNSTVTLNGCFMLVEFQGDISTERAKGKPSRMTCVYPDQGAVTYSLSGYVVDSEDGVEGVPGLFFEGHAGRIALAIAAEFASGIADIVESNQSTSTVDSNGTAVSTITGSQSKASIYGSASDSLDTLQQYLANRASRVVPFIRLDALREVNIVLLSGTRLRKEGDAWSQLFKAE
ncbi:MAG: hypothetical protein GY793_11345 [Proteobacteria bacterium]|nr:hypothetical protein [Pseudomonadota bacterium]